MKTKSLGRVPLERALSKLGLSSRIEARELIENGSVKVHGTIERNAKRMVNPDTAHIEVMGKKVIRDETVILLFHKPKGTLTTKRDPEGRKTIYDLLPKEFQHLHPVGRLDQHTTGLLLLTNDTKLSSFLTDPKNEIPRTYLVSVKGNFSEVESARAKNGIEVDGETYQAKSIEILKSSGKESKIIIVLTEGKNREIRKICSALAHEVITLKRLEFGEYNLGELKSGEFKLIKK